MYYTNYIRKADGTKIYPKGKLYNKYTKYVSHLIKEGLRESSRKSSNISIGKCEKAKFINEVLFDFLFWLSTISTFIVKGIIYQNTQCSLLYLVLGLCFEHNEVFQFFEIL